MPVVDEPTGRSPVTLPTKQSPPAKVRLFADPTRVASFAAGGAQQLKQMWEAVFAKFGGGAAGTSAADKATGLTLDQAAHLFDVSTSVPNSRSRGSVRGLPSVLNVPAYVPKPYQSWVRGAAQGTGLPASVVAAQIQDESTFDPNATGPQTKYGTAKGIAQFLDSTWKTYGVGSPYDPNAAQKAYIGYMNVLLHQYHGNIRDALAAYGGGLNPGGYAYADKILNAANVRGAAKAGSPSTYGGTRPGGGAVDGSGGGGGGGGGSNGQAVTDLFAIYEQELTAPRIAPQSGFTPASQAGIVAPFVWWWQSFSGNWTKEQGG